MKIIVADLSLKEIQSHCSQHFKDVKIKKRTVTTPDHKVTKFSFLSSTNAVVCFPYFLTDFFVLRECSSLDLYNQIFIPSYYDFLTKCS